MRRYRIGGSEACRLKIGSFLAMFIVVLAFLAALTEHVAGPGDFFFTVARGEVTGMSSVNKFGRNIDIDQNASADIWDGGHTGSESLVWVAPTADAIHNFTSSDPADTANGGGARTISVSGLTDWDTAQISETITMAGTSTVASVNSYVIIHRMSVLTSGSTDINVGTITATATAPSSTTVTALIRPSQGQTQMAIYGIPSTQTAFVGRFYASANKTGGAVVKVDVSLEYNSQPKTVLTTFTVRHTFGLLSGGTTSFTIPYYVPKVFAGPGILKIMVSSSLNNMDISAGFDIVLADN